MPRTTGTRGRGRSRPPPGMGRSSVEELRTVDCEVAGAEVLPGVIALLQLAIDAPDRAGEEAARLAAACRALEADAPDASLWWELADVIEAAFARRGNYQALR